MEACDVLILGSGEAGKFIAWTLAKKGMKVVVVERRWIGGSCPNVACLPSKNVIHSAKVASYFFRSGEFGISKDHVRIDLAAVRERKRKMVQGLVDVHVANYQKSGAELVMGSGRFVGPRTLEVALNAGGTRTLQGRHVVINAGTRARIDDTPGLSQAKPLTHVELLELDVVPQHLVILGGGFVGLEFAQAFRRLGSEVTVVDRNARLAPHEDPDVGEGLQQLFQEDGIRVVTSAYVLQVEGASGARVRLTGARDGGEFAVEGTHLLAAAGRVPNTAGLGLDAAGVALAKNGYIQVDERLHTSAPNVWAAGDCTGNPQSTHLSYDDFRIISDNILGGSRVTTGRQVPSCLFTDPQYARIGLSETEAKARGLDYRMKKIPMAADLRTRTLSETRGFLKALIDAKTERILGFSAFGVEAGELLGPVQVAMQADLPYTVLRDLIFAHPTLQEGLMVLFSS